MLLSSINNEEGKISEEQDNTTLKVISSRNSTDESSSSIACSSFSFRPSNHDTMMMILNNNDDEKSIADDEKNNGKHTTTIISKICCAQQEKEINIPISDIQQQHHEQKIELLPCTPSPANNTTTTTTSITPNTTTSNNESIIQHSNHVDDEQQNHHTNTCNSQQQQLHEDMIMKKKAFEQTVCTKKDRKRTNETKHVLLIDERRNEEHAAEEDASHHLHTRITFNKQQEQQHECSATTTITSSSSSLQHEHDHHTKSTSSLEAKTATTITTSLNSSTIPSIAGNHHKHQHDVTTTNIAHHNNNQQTIITDEDIEDDVESFDDEFSSLSASFRQHRSKATNGNNTSSFSFFGAYDEMSVIEVSSPTDMTTPSTPSFDSSTSNQSATSAMSSITTGAGGACVITKLDDDTIGVILSYCSIPEFENLSCTCRSFYNKFHLSYIYRQVFKKLNSKNSNKKSSRHYKSNHLQITPFLRDVLRNRYNPTIFVPIRCMQFNAYTRFKDAIIDYWVKEFGFKRLNDAEVEIEIDFSKSNPWIDHLEKIVMRNTKDQNQSDSTTIPRTISQLEILKKDQPFLKPIMNERKNNSRSLSPFGALRQQNSDMPNSSNVLSDLLKTIVELRHSGSVLRQQTVSNKFTDPNELDITDSQRVALNGAKSLIVANHWRVFDKFTLHIDFQFPSHERHFSFVEMPEITMYYHNFRSADGNPRKDLIEVSSGSIFKDGVDGKVFEFDSLATESGSGISPLNGKPSSTSSPFSKAASYQPVPSPSNSMSAATVGDFKKPPKFTPVNGNSPYPAIAHGTNPFNSITQPPPKKKSRFFKKNNQTSVTLPEERKKTKGFFENTKFAFEDEKFEYDPIKVGKVLLYFILHDFCPRYFSDYFSPKLASLESKAQQTKLQYLMKYYEKEDPNVVIDYLTINRNQLKQYRNKMIRKHTSREARRHMVKDNCMSLVRNFAKLVPYINYDQMTSEQKTYLLKTMVFNHVNPQDFLSMSDQLFMSSSFFGELRFNPTINSPFQINILPRKCQTRDDPRPVWDYMINDQESDNVSHSSLMSTADEIEYDSFQIYFDTLYTDMASSAFSVTGLDMPAVNSEKIIVQRHILEIPTKFMMRCVTYHTPKNNAKNDSATTTTSSRSFSSMLKALFCGGDKMQ